MATIEFILSIGKFMFILALLTYIDKKQTTLELQQVPRVVQLLESAPLTVALVHSQGAVTP
jgi:hypothetical protein